MLAKVGVGGLPLLVVMRRHRVRLTVQMTFTNLRRVLAHPRYTPRMRLSWIALIAVLLAGCNAPHATSEPAASSGQAIAWRSYADGLAQAKEDGRPLLVVISATWCPHCRNYKQVFQDPRVIEAARKFVMVQVDEDREPAVAARYTRDGSYVPRTYFLAPDGSLADVQAENPRYRYFYDERDPASILAGMSAALRRVPN